MAKAILALTLFASVLSSAMPSRAHANEGQDIMPSNDASVEGVATWYGADFHGRRMFNGEIFNMYNPSITAANAFPIGTWLRVTRLATGDSILVRVTDRGAFQYPDLTDLSYAAFARLAAPSTGVIRVRVEPAYPATPTPVATAIPTVVPTVAPTATTVATAEPEEPRWSMAADLRLQRWLDLEGD